MVRPLGSSTLSEGIPKALLTIQGEKIIDLIIAKFLKIDDFHFNLICSIKHKQYWEEYAQNSNIDVNIILKLRSSIQQDILLNI